MPTFIMLTHRTEVDGDVAYTTRVERRIGREASKARWWMRYPADAGAWCAVDIFEAPDLAAALLISNRIADISGRRTELWPVMGSFEASSPATQVAGNGHKITSLLERSWRQGTAVVRQWTGLVARPVAEVLEPVGEAN